MKNKKLSPSAEIKAIGNCHRPIVLSKKKVNDDTSNVIANKLIRKKPHEKKSVGRSARLIGKAPPNIYILFILLNLYAKNAINSDKNINNSHKSTIFREEIQYKVMYMNNDTWLKKTKIFLNRQVFRFMIVGLTCASLEFSIFHVLYSVHGIDYLAANVVSVVIAIFVNYFLSRKFVFQPSKHSVAFEVSTFIVFSAAAILLNHFILWFLVEILEFEQIGLCKAVTIVSVAVFNFATKKYIVFKNN